MLTNRGGYSFVGNGGTYYILRSAVLLDPHEMYEVSEQLVLAGGNCFQQSQSNDGCVHSICIRLRSLLVDVFLMQPGRWMIPSTMQRS